MVIDEVVGIAYPFPMDEQAVLTEAVRAAGGTAALARAIGTTPQAISQWRRVPAARVIEVEAVSGVSRERLRPDLYPGRPGSGTGSGDTGMRPEQKIRGETPRPFTGAEYIESLKDGREVYIDGERVEDVASHPAFRNSVRSIARLYDALHDPATKEMLTHRLIPALAGLRTNISGSPVRARSSLPSSARSPNGRA